VRTPITMDDQNRGGLVPKEQSPVTKKRYQRPAFRYERVFETLALSCGKILQTAVCMHNKKTS
jgi:hypothetical protein